jgi:hypothetical protein
MSEQTEKSTFTAESLWGVLSTAVSERIRTQPACHLLWAILETHLTRRERKRCKFARMKQQPIADLYSDYLLASFGATTATGLSQLLEGKSATIK